MPVIREAETVLLDLTPQSANRLMLKPALVYSNPLQNDLELFEIVFEKHKVRMNHLSTTENNLQPKLPCNKWNPTVRQTLAPSEFMIYDYELNGEQCTDEFDRGTARYLKAPQPRDRFDTTQELNALEGAMLATLGDGLKGDIYKIIWFSDPNFNTTENLWGKPDLSHYNPEEEAKFVNMMKVNKEGGLWYKMAAYADEGQIPYVDVNNGTASINATLPGNVTDFLDDMIASANPILRYSGSTMANPNGTQPLFFVSPGIFKALKKYYKSISTDAAYQFMLNGEPVKGTLTYDGYLVQEHPEWDMFDFRTGQTGGPYQGSVNQRAIFTLPRNITIGANMQPLEGFPDSGIIIQQSTHVKDKGVKWMYYSLGLGADFAHTELAVIGYNSSKNYVSS